MANNIGSEAKSAFCAKCGKPIDGGVKFCTSCGAAVSSPSSPAASPQAGRKKSFGLKFILIAAVIVLALGFVFFYSGGGGGLSFSGGGGGGDGVENPAGPANPIKGGVGSGGNPSNGGGYTGSYGSGGKTHKTVKIGTQTWMAENLNYAVAGSKCYNNDPANCAKYGHLYDWSTAMGLPSSCNSNSCSSQIQSKHRGICPSGWHIPSAADWNALVTAVGGRSTAGTKLKAKSGWNNYQGKSGNGTDEFRFSALPGGFGHSDGSFDYVGNRGNWWSSTADLASFASLHFMGIDYSKVDRDNRGKSNLGSVRCLQD